LIDCRVPHYTVVICYAFVFWFLPAVRYYGRVLSFLVSLTVSSYRYLGNGAPPYLHLATSEMWCWSGGRGISML